jgi:hypothetical protein
LAKPVGHVVVAQVFEEKACGCEACSMWDVIGVSQLYAQPFRLN